MKATLRWVLLGGALALSACAAMRSISTEVSSYGEWPAGRKPASYAFERLPSQQARPAESAALEAAARSALAAAGFKLVEPGKEPEVLVQIGARDTRSDQTPWDDALWWRGGFGHWRHGPWLSPRWGLSLHHELPRYERHVALLMRDRASGKPLFETHASSEGNLRLDEGLLGAMFTAAMTDFPRLGPNPRRVVVTLPN